MALEKETVKLWFGIGIGAGAALASPFVLPVLAAVGRPLFKAALSQSLLAVERAREGLARAGEALSDVVAEVKAEAAQRSAAQKQAFAAAAAGSGHDGGRARGEPN
jgi:hypothetical protein